jgi:hypothetical protein
MIIYNSTKKGFLSDVETDSIATKVESMLLHKMGRHTGKSEFRSWEN